MRHVCLWTAASLLMSVGVAPLSAEVSPGWLGAQVGPVPPILRVQLNLKEEGVMVLNVAESGPADKAGLEQFDVITQINQGNLMGVEQLIDKIRKTPPGTKITLRVVHRAQSKDVEVVVASQPSGRIHYKYDRLPDALMDDRFDVRGKIFRKGPGGWSMEDLGEMEDMPRFLEDLVPPSRGGERRFWYDDSSDPPATFQIRVKRDSQIIDIEGAKDGKITVRRTETKGDAKTVREQTYENADALKKADAEAFEIYKDATDKQQSGARRPHGMPPRMRRDWAEDDARYRDRLRDLLNEKWKDLAEKRGDYEKRLQEGLDSATRQIEEMRKRLDQYLSKPWSSPLVEPGAAGPTTQPSKLSCRFDVAPDGKIIVQLRTGNTVQNLHFDSIDQLKAQRPDLLFEALRK